MTGMDAQSDIAVFARVASRPIPRVLRMMGVAGELGYEPVFCGALRQTGLERSGRAGGWRLVRLGRYYPMLNGRHPLVYLRSIIAFNRDLYRYLKTTRPRLVHASDIETLPAAVLYRWRRGARLVYNIHDNLAQRYRIPRPLAAVLNGLEGLGVLAADAALVPERFRRSALPRWCRRKVAVVRNTPVDQGYSAPVDDVSAVRVFFAGWLDWGRGLRALIDMAEDTAALELRVAGEGAPDVVAELQVHPRVSYLGFLDHDAVMEETRRCHFVAALYDPARPINRFAAPNKLAEAFSVGRPVIVNREVLVVKDLSPNECLVDADYRDAARLGDRLVSLARDRVRYLAACREARRLYDEHYAWEPVLQEMRRVLAGEDAV